MAKISKRTAAILGITGLVVTAGVAYAAWTSSGSGSGSVTSTTSVNSTISPATPGEALYPGATTTFTVRVDNPNDYPIVVNSISAGSSDLAGSCAAGTVTSDALTTPPATVIAPKTTGAYTLTAHMAADASDACKGASFSLPLSATISSAAS
ncbi:hypothetical protein ACIA2T_33705 [Amycolatopsis japonica]|uniref:hypothetical protein n=1 Tax=Amycolatopsis japonica TaxID=208439 RepID=UPI003792B25A